MTDLVTGATGFVGLHLVGALVAGGRRVRCVVRERGRAAALEASGAEIVQAELRDAGALAPFFAGVERVFHLAGGGKVSAMSPQALSLLRAANVDPLRAVLEAAARAGVQSVVCFSSISAMGVQLDVPLDEHSPCHPRTPHEIAKYESEQVALDAHRQAGLPVVILRPSQIYGPGDVRSEIPALVRLARRGLVPLFGGGEGRVPWVFVSDVVDATLAAADNPTAVGQIYIVSDVEPYRFRDVVQTIAAACGRRRGGIVVPDAIAKPAIFAAEKASRMLRRDPPFTLHRYASLTGRRVLRVDRAQRELGYLPRVGLREGIERTVRWYAERRIA